MPLFRVNFLVQSCNNLYKLQELPVDSLMLSLLFHGQMPALEIRMGFFERSGTEVVDSD